MVRLYLPPRFSKKRMGDKVAEKALETFGGPTFFRHSKVVHSMACYLNKNGQLCSIDIQAGAPYCPKDFWMLQFLRTYSDCIVTTGKILRKEPQAFDTSMMKSLGFDPHVFFDKPKPIAILSNNINENLISVGNRVYGDKRYRKHILTKDSNLARLLEFSPSIKDKFETEGNTSIDAVKNLNLRKGISHLQNNYNYEMILLEAGASTTVPCYSETHNLSTRKAPPIDFTCDGNPIDTLYLSIFEGSLHDIGNDQAPENADTSYISGPFINMHWLQSQYNLVHMNDPDRDVYNFGGTCTQTFWRKKSPKELQKLREKSLGLRLVDYQSEKWQKWQQQSDYYKTQFNQKEQESKQKRPEYASRSVDFERKKYPWMSAKGLATKKPKV